MNTTTTIIDVVSLQIFVVLSSVVTADSSRTHIVGETASISCSVAKEHDTVLWTHQTTDEAAPVIVYAGGSVRNGYRQRFSVDTSTGQRYDLIIKDIQPSDAGVYRCIDDGGLGEEMSRVSVILQLPQGMIA